MGVTVGVGVGVGLVVGVAVVGGEDDSSETAGTAPAQPVTSSDSNAATTASVGILPRTA
jgi:hypothetical protein